MLFAVREYCIDMALVLHGQMQSVFPALQPSPTSQGASRTGRVESPCPSAPCRATDTR